MSGIVYGKSELQPGRDQLASGATYIRTSFCKNLHAKCLNEEMCIVTSLNLYEFSQVNNNEMGVLILRSDDGELLPRCLCRKHSGSSESVKRCASRWKAGHQQQ